MTAEIAIMNKEAVALAADSAVTVFESGTPRVFVSTNKLFSLSRHHPVGIMVYGNASFMGVPWETVIKLYRARLDDNSYPTVKEYADDFISFLESEPVLTPEESQQMYVRGTLNTYFEWMFQETDSGVRKRIREEAISTPEDAPEFFRQEARRVIGSHYQSWKEAAYARDLGAEFAGELRRLYQTDIRQAKRSAFGSLLTSDTSRKLTILAGWILSKYNRRVVSPGESGLVIAGFGDDQIFPSIQSFVVLGIAGGKLKYWREDGDSRDITANVGARIIPFAQDEMVRSFMEGIEPDYWADILSAVNGLLEEYPLAIIDNIRGVSNRERERLKRSVLKASKDAFDAFNEDFDDIKISRYIDPVVSTIATMPKSELPAVFPGRVQDGKPRCSRKRELIGEEIGDGR